MTAHDPAIDAFVQRATTWQDEIRCLRTILLECGLDEALKWGKPCYALEGSNVALIQPFKAHCSLMFFKGVLLEDDLGLLRRPGKNSRSTRRLEFTAADGIEPSVVKTYVEQAIAVEAAGLAVEPERELEIPGELTQVLRANPALATAFRGLTPGRQRAYVLHFEGARRPETRRARIERSAPWILAGKGPNGR